MLAHECAVPAEGPKIGGGQGKIEGLLNKKKFASGDANILPTHRPLVLPALHKGTSSERVKFRGAVEKRSNMSQKRVETLS